MSQASRGFVLFFIVSAFCPTTNARSLVVGLPMLEPYATRHDGEISGMYVDLLQAVFRHMGENCIIRVMPPTRMIHEFMSGALDVTVLANNKPTLSRVGYLTKEPLSSDRIVLLGRANNTLKAKVSALPINASIAALRGFSPKLRFLEKHEVILVKSRGQLVKMLLAGRVDYIMAEETITSYFAQQRDFPPLFSVLLLENQSIYTAFSKLRLGEVAGSLAHRFDASLKQLIQQGDLPPKRPKNALSSRI